MILENNSFFRVIVIGKWSKFGLVVEHRTLTVKVQYRYGKYELEEREWTKSESALSPSSRLQF
jgi:hypothetical protein